jgi:cytidylate kinase
MPRIYVEDVITETNLNQYTYYNMKKLIQEDGYKMGFNIAIDGPAGAGKSTIAKRVAKELDFIYVDTGAMYRAMALYLLNNGVNRDDTEAIATVCSGAEISIAYEDGLQQVYLNGENVTGRLREEAVGNMASVSSAVPEVRQKLLMLQKNLAAENDVVMDGRDIGTNILPHAQVKIYLTASVETRAKRRYLELTEKGEACDMKQIAADIQERDERDMNRETAPLRQAEDAYYLDSSDLTIDEVVNVILKQAGEK